MASSYSTHLSTLSPILSFVGWWFVPGYLSGLVLGIFYWLRPSWRPSMPPPPPTTSEQKPIFNPSYELQKLEHDRRSRHHRSLAHGLVISVYLGYTLISTYQEQGGTNYYAVLGLKSNSLAFTAPVPGTTNPTPVKAKVPKGDLLDEAGFKSHWRKLARSFHPDKLNPPQNLQTDEDITLWKSEVESKFIQMREAYETLSDGTKQWAYDRFGPTIGQWKNCITMREYLLEGLKSSSPFYVFTFGSLSLIGSVRKIDPGSFWRWSILMCIVTAEAIVLTSTSTTAVTLLMSGLFPNRAPFEQIELLRKLFIAGSCVATQLSGILYPIPPELSKKQTVGELVAPVTQLVEHTQQMSGLANVEVVKLIFNDLHPIIRTAGIRPSETSSEKGAQQAMTASDEQGSSRLAEENAELRKIIEDLKEKMLDTFCDLRLQSDPNGQAAWIEAIQPQSSSSTSTT